MAEKNLIVPTQDIAFAAKKDGSFISNFMGGGETIDPHVVIAAFNSVVNYIKNCSEKEFMMFSVIYLIEYQSVTRAITSRMENLKNKKENE